MNTIRKMAGMVVAFLVLPPAFAPAAESAAILPGQLGAEVGRRYSGDGVGVTATATGAKVKCVFQRMEGEVTKEQGITTIFLQDGWEILGI